MDINFPLVLVCAVAISGVVWLIDALFFAKGRAARVADVKAKMDDGAGEEARQLAIDAAAQEPMLVEYSKSFFPVLAIVLVLRSFIAEPFQIPSGSMIPTLKVGDFILVNKFAYGLRLPVLRTKIIDVNEPKRGEVMVFFPPHKPDTYFIKRIIGVPGDHILLKNHQLYVNGEAVPQKTLAKLPPARPSYELARETMGGKEHNIRMHVVPGQLSRKGEWVVKEGHYFMMGDNRDESSDSRVWGQVPEENIVGKAFAVWMHWESFLSIPSFDNVGSIE